MGFDQEAAAVMMSRIAVFRYRLQAPNYRVTYPSHPMSYLLSLKPARPRALANVTGLKFENRTRSRARSPTLSRGHFFWDVLLTKLEEFLFLVTSTKMKRGWLFQVLGRLRQNTQTFWPKSQNDAISEIFFKVATSRFAYLEKFSLNFSSSSFVIRVYLHHP